MIKFDTVKGLILGIFITAAFATPSHFYTTPGQIFTGRIQVMNGDSTGTAGGQGSTISTVNPYDPGLTIQGSVYAPTFILPNTLSGLVVWLRSGVGYYKDAAKTVPATADGDLIYTWADSSGLANDATQSSSGIRPLLETNIVNGKSVTRFVQSDGDYMNITDNSSIHLAAMSAFVVFQERSSGDSGNVDRSFFDRRCGNGSNWEMGLQANTQRYYFANGAAQRVFTTGPTSNVFYAMAEVGDQSSVSDYQNGTVLSPSSFADPIGSSSVACDSQIGGLGYYGNGYFANADIAEIILYNRKLTTTEIASITAYLNATFNLAGTVINQTGNLLQLKSATSTLLSYINPAGLFTPPSSTTAALPAACGAGTHIWNTSINKDCVCNQSNAWKLATDLTAACS